MSDTDSSRVNVELARLRDAGQLTAAYCDMLAEQVISCMDECGHSSGAVMALSGCMKAQLEITWNLPADQGKMASTYADLNECTEYGAIGIAILIMMVMKDLFVVQKSPKDGNGFDYYLAPKGHVGALFQGTTRLEVSGLLRGKKSDVESRLKTKLQQIRKSSSMKLDGYALVVEFANPMAQAGVA